MDNKFINLEDEGPKYKKKAVSKGLPRSKHKHTYETALLHRKWNGTDFKTGKPKIEVIPTPTKVCTICGRIDRVDKDSKYYNRNIIPHLPFIAYENELSEEALKLPKWSTEDFFDKFAIKEE